MSVGAYLLCLTSAHFLTCLDYFFHLTTLCHDSLTMLPLFASPTNATCAHRYHRNPQVGVLKLHTSIIGHGHDPDVDSPKLNRGSPQQVVMAAGSPTDPGDSSNAHQSGAGHQVCLDTMTLSDCDVCSFCARCICCVPPCIIL